MDSSIDRITELAAIVSRNTEQISSYLSQHSLAPPSFNADAPLDLPEVLRSARKAVVEATEELKLLMQGPKEAIKSETEPDLISLHIIINYGIAKSFPVDQEATFAEISETCGLGKQEVRHVLRHAMTKRIFREPRKGVVAHTAASRVLAQDTAFADYVDVSLGEMWPAASQTVSAMRKWPGSRSPAHTGFSFSKGSEETLFEHLGRNPRRAEKFASGMSVYGLGPIYGLDHFVNNDFLWTTNHAEPTVVVVDIGGSTGETMIALTTKLPQITAVVQDLPNPIAKHVVAPAEIEERITFMVHDFFNEQPVTDADFYLFRLVLHNWSDDDCVLILRALMPALRPGARVVVNEFCLPELRSTSIFEERESRAMDMRMMSLLNAGERDAGEWMALFKNADPRFYLEGIKTSRGSNLAIIEVVWTG